MFEVKAFLSRHARPRATASVRETSPSNIMLLSTIVTVLQIKFTLKRLLNSLLSVMVSFLYETNDNIWYGLYLLNYLSKAMSVLFFMHESFALLRILMINTFLWGQFKLTWAGSK